MSDKEHGPPSLFSSLRRSVVRVAPSALVEEMRPMLLRSSTTSSVGTAQQRPSATAPRHHSNNSSIISTANLISGTPSASSASTTTTAAASSAAFEISLRDKSDATAKRGFRVQVPKRMLFYTILVFVGLPLFLFGYVEVHNRGIASHEKDTVEHHQTHDNHVYDKYKLSSLMDIDGDDGDEGAKDATEAPIGIGTKATSAAEALATSSIAAESTIAPDEKKSIRTSMSPPGDVVPSVTVPVLETARGNATLDSPHDELAVGNSTETHPAVRDDGGTISEGTEPPHVEQAVSTEEKTTTEGERRRRLRGRS